MQREHDGEHLVGLAPRVVQQCGEARGVSGDGGHAGLSVVRGKGIGLDCVAEGMRTGRTAAVNSSSFPRMRESINTDLAISSDTRCLWVPACAGTTVRGFMGAAGPEI